MYNFLVFLTIEMTDNFHISVELQYVNHMLIVFNIFEIVIHTVLLVNFFLLCDYLKPTTHLFGTPFYSCLT